MKISVQRNKKYEEDGSNPSCIANWQMQDKIGCNDCKLALLDNFESYSFTKKQLNETKMHQLQLQK